MTENTQNKELELIEVWINAIYLALTEEQKEQVLDKINKYMKENLK